MLARSRWDLLIVAFRFPGGDAESVAATARQESPRPAVLVLADAEELSEAWTRGPAAGWAGVVPRTAKGLVELPSIASRALRTIDEGRTLARMETRLQSLLDQADIGFFRANLDGELLEVSSALLRLLGVADLDEMGELPLPAPYFRRRSRGDLLDLMDEQGALNRQRLVLRRPDGRSIAVDLTECLRLDDGGELVVDGLVSDGTRSRETEEEVAQWARELDRSNQDLQRFAYVASHELQSPLRRVGQHSELLAEALAGRLEGDAKESLAAIVEGVERMQKLIDDLLAFSRVESRAGDLRPVDSGAVLQEAMADLAGAIEESGARFAIGDLPTVRADAEQLRLLFENLLGNAIKFRGEQRPEIRISSERREDGWQLEIRDNGIGIAPEDQEQIFDVFRRLHPEFPGSGIGLAVSRRIVERHGGTLGVDSEPGVGSTFRFVLPAADDPGEEVVDVRSATEESPADREETK